MPDTTQEADKTAQSKSDTPKTTPKEQQNAPIVVSRRQFNDFALI